MRIWDIAAGRNFSLFLSDSDRTKTNVYFCGEVNGYVFSYVLINDCERLFSKCFGND